MTEEFTQCPQCGMKSYGRGDIEHQYCDNCKQFYSEMNLVTVVGFKKKDMGKPYTESIIKNCED